MKLQDIWKKYEDDIEFNLSVIPEEVRRTGVTMHFAPRQRILTKGDEVKYIYFIQEGKAIGQREYANGQEYTYFRVNKNGGNLGLLEILSGNETLIASIIALTDVTAVRIDAALILETIMTDIHMLRRCTSLVARDLYRESGTEGRYYYVEGINRIRYYLIDCYNQMRMEDEYIKAGTGKKAADEFCIDVQYQDIANSTGISIRTVGRSLKKMKESGEIHSVRQKIYVGTKELRKLEDALLDAEN